MTILQSRVCRVLLFFKTVKSRRRTKSECERNGKTTNKVRRSVEENKEMTQRTTREPDVVVYLQHDNNDVCSPGLWKSTALHINRRSSSIVCVSVICERGGVVRHASRATTTASFNRS